VTEAQQDRRSHANRIEAKAKLGGREAFRGKWLEAERQREVKPGFQAWHVVAWLSGVSGRHQARPEQRRQSSPRAAQIRSRTTTASSLPIKLPRLTGLKLEVLPQNNVLSRGKTGEFILTDIKVQVRSTWQLADPRHRS
jgi:hypothetical protein